MSDDLLAAAVDELYAADPDAFMDRRTELVTQAKAAKATDAAKRIGALRKPTRSAYAINRLARDDPETIRRLLDLADRWRAAERTVDARQIRELTKRRRQLIDELARAAFAAVNESNPSSAVRDEVVATFTAALTDEAVAGDIERGVLVKPARWEGFGFGGPELTLVPSTGPDESATAAPPQTPVIRNRTTPAERRAAREAAEQAEADRRARAEQEAAQAREHALADARQALDEAEEKLILATDEEQARADRVQELEQEIAEARRAVDDARREVRRAEIAQRRTQDALRRLEQGRS